MFLINVFKKYLNSNAVYNLQFFNHFWYNFLCYLRQNIYENIISNKKAYFIGFNAEIK